MEQEPTDRERIRAAGKELELADGRTVIVRFDFDALCRLEQDFGSLRAFSDAINEQDEAGPTGAILTTTRRALAAALAGQGLGYSELGPLLDVERRFDYPSVVVAAYNEALAPSDGPGKASAAKSGSHGETSTTPPPSPSDEPMPPSGA
jgi:hypothetical protein